MGLLFLVLTLLVGNAVAQNWALLSEKRKDAQQVVTYSAIQKHRVVNSMDSLLDVYVNRQVKIDEFKRERTDIDPIPRVKAIATKAANMTDLDFQLEMLDIVNSQRDLHTNYYMPGPHACYIVFQGLRFAHIGESRDEKIVISEVYKTSPFNLIAPQISEFNIGDQIVKVNGKKVMDFLDSLKWESGGANDDAVIKRGLSLMFARSGMFNALPEKDFVEYEIISVTGEKKKLEMPWLIRDNGACLSSTKALAEYLKTPAADDTTASIGPKVINPRKYRNIPALNERQEILAGALPKKDLYNNVILQPTSDEIVSWTIYKPESHNLGIIRLESFVPSGQNTDTTIADIIKGLLSNELKSTASVVFDIRGNGGGYLGVADIIPQLVTPVFKTAFGRAVKSKINDIIMSENSKFHDEDWKRAYHETPAGSTYTKLTKFNADADVNQIGQWYSHPVAVLTDAECFSACDIFAANLQDHGNAILFGEDKTTGAGGANVYTMDDFQNWAPIAFPGFPGSEVTSITKGVQSARAAFRQLIRSGKNSGKVLEGIGAVSDIVVRPELTDIMGTSNTQLDRIARRLKSHPRAGLEFSVAQPQLLSHNLGSDLFYTVDIAGFKRIDIESEGFERTSIELKSMFRQKLEFSLDKKISEPTLKKYEIFGIDYLGQQLFRAVRTVKFLPALDSYLKLQNDIQILARPNASYFAIYQPRSNKLTGWKNKKGAYILGNGTSYANNVDSTISAFVASENSFQVKFSLDYETEADYDFITAGYVADGVAKELFKVSGTGSIDQTFDVPPGRYEIFIHFLSDSYSTAKGAELKDLSFLLKLSSPTVTTSPTTASETDTFTSIQTSTHVATSEVTITTSISVPITTITTGDYTATSIGLPAPTSSTSQSTITNVVTYPTATADLPTSATLQQSSRPHSYPTLSPDSPYSPVDDSTQPINSPTNEKPYGDASSGTRMGVFLSILLFVAAL